MQNRPPIPGPPPDDDDDLPQGNEEGSAFSLFLVLPSFDRVKMTPSGFSFVYQIVYQFSNCWLDGRTTHCKQIHFLFVCDLSCK